MLTLHRFLNIQVCCYRGKLCTSYL